MQFIEDKGRLEKERKSAAVKRKAKGSTDEHGDILAEIDSDLEEDEEDEEDEDSEHDEDSDKETEEEAPPLVKVKRAKR